MEKFNKDINKMNSFLVALILTVLMMVLSNEKIKMSILSGVTKIGPGKALESFLDKHSFSYSLIIGLIFFVLTFIVLYFSRKSSEGFFFEVSKGLPRCSRGYIGRPNSFQYSSSNDISCGYGGDNPVSCQKTAEDAKNNPYFGWDGIVNVKPDNIFGGCGCADSGMTVYPYVRSQIETPCQQTYM